MHPFENLLHLHTVLGARLQDTDFLQLKNLTPQVGGAPLDQIQLGDGVERNDRRVRTQDIRIKSQVFQAV